MRRIPVLWLLLACLTGCYAFPTSGAVEHAEATVDTELNQGIAVTAQPPVEGATPQAIIEGFFAAQESYADGYAVARQYLRPDVATIWKPDTGITVYDVTGSTLVVSSSGRAVLQATVIGRVDGDGVYTSVHEENFTHDFELSQVDGQWRISNAPDGLLMSTQRFHRAYSPVLINFLNAAGTRLVPQQVYVHTAEVVSSSADVLVRALIAGPRAQLRASVVDALPSEITSNGTRIDDRGIAHVNLSAAAEALPAEQRELAAVQLLATLAQLPEVTGLSLTANGKALSVPIADSQNIVRTSILTQYRSTREASVRNLYAIADSKVLVISAEGQTTTPLPGELGQGWAHDPESLAVDWFGFNLAVVADGGTTLHVATTANGNPSQVYAGTDLIRPQYGSDSTLWTVDNTPEGPLLVMVDDGRVRTNRLTELGTSTVVALRVSTDMTKLALVVDVGGHQVFGTIGLRPTDGTAEGWQEIPVNSRNGLLTQIRDVAFTSSTRLMLIGASARDPKFTVHSLDLDASQVDFQGPLTDVSAVELATLPATGTPQVAIRTSDGTVLGYEAQYRWPTVTQGVSAIACPS